LSVQTIASNVVKGDLGKSQIYIRKIPLHQQKILVVSVLSNSLWLLRNWKNVQNETTTLFSVGNACFYRNGATTDFLYLLHDDIN